MGMDAKRELETGFWLNSRDRLTVLMGGRGYTLRRKVAVGFLWLLTFSGFAFGRVSEFRKCGINQQ
jgi:hypothetical protein